MELTENEAIEKTREMWRLLTKYGWAKEEYAEIYPEVRDIAFKCYLCEFSNHSSFNIGCPKCPYPKYYKKRCCQAGSALDKWDASNDSIDRSYWAKRVLEEVEQIPLVEEPIKEPEWIDVTFECKPLIVKNGDAYYVTLQHEGRHLLQWGGDNQVNNCLAEHPSYKLELTGTGYNLNMFRILKRADK